MAEMNPILKNIYEQPQELKRVLADLTGPKLSQLRELAQVMQSANELVLTSMGSAFYSLMPMYEELLDRGYRNVRLEETGDVLRHPERMNKDALYLLMSRSGESREVADFALWCEKRGYTTLSITMTPTSTMALHSTYMLHDISSYDDIVCIKAYSTMALAGLLLVEMMDGREAPAPELIEHLEQSFDWMETNKERILAELEAIPFLDEINSFYLLSRSWGVNMMRSASLWLEETAKIQASMMSLDNFFHGPMELIRSQKIVRTVCAPVLFDTQDDARAHKIWNEAHVSSPYAIYVGPRSSEYPAAAHIDVPELGLSGGWSMIYCALYFQLFSYQMALVAGIEPGFFYDEAWVVT